MKVSGCCNAPVKIVWRDQWRDYNPKAMVSNWTICLACSQPCDTIEKEGEGDESRQGDFDGRI